MKTHGSLFTPIVPPEKLHQLFPQLSQHRGHLPARTELQRAYDLFPSRDGNFIKDFQSTGFDARIWELYLTVLFNDLDLSPAQPKDRPDFRLVRGTESAWIEATTANATQGAPQPEPEGYWDKSDNIAAKVGSPLFSKLQKRYWELPHVAGMPLVLAVADFHDSDPVRPNSDPLRRYLYGRHLALTSAPGEVVSYEMHPIKTLGARKVPAGFFALPEAKHISAVLFSNAGTVAKFSRMGFDFSLHPYMRMLRYGFSFNETPAALVPEPFAYIAGDAPETWGQEAVVLHNPHALYPLSQDFFAPLCQYWLVDDTFQYTVPDLFPYLSSTLTLCGAPTMMPALENRMRTLGRRWVLRAWDRESDFEQEIAAFHREWREANKKSDPAK